MRLFVLSNELEVVEIVLVKSRIGEILLGELLQRLFVENVLEMFKLQKSALQADQLWLLLVDLQ